MNIHETIPITLSDKNVGKVFNAGLDLLCGGPDTYFNKKGEIEKWTSWPHGSGTTETVKNPSAVQKAALTLRDLLDEARNEGKTK